MKRFALLSLALLAVWLALPLQAEATGRLRVRRIVRVVRVVEPPRAFIRFRAPAVAVKFNSRQVIQQNVEYDCYGRQIVTQIVQDQYGNKRIERFVR